MKKGLLSFTLFVSTLCAEIREIDRLEEILPQASSGSIVLLDVDEVLIEPPIMLGGKAWRQYVRNVLKTEKSPAEVDQIHDKLTYWIALRVPYVAVEKEIPSILEQLHQRHVDVFGFTARGKYHWYDMPLEGAEELTIQQLKQAGLTIPWENCLFSHPSWGQGVFFAYPIEDKGELVLEVFARRRPHKVIFVDDKMENIRSVDKAFEQLNIPALCYYYRPVDLRPFDPIVAHIQLEKLFFENKTLSNEEALLLKQDYQNKNPDDFFKELIKIILWKR